jgi:hypothetical protein
MGLVSFELATLFLVRVEFLNLFTGLGLVADRFERLPQGYMSSGHTGIFDLALAV